MDIERETPCIMDMERATPCNELRGYMNLGYLIFSDAKLELVI